MEQHDHDIRVSLQPYLSMTSNADDKIINEFGIGDSRADMLVVKHDHMDGYEIKSDTDTLIRLPRQVVDYGRICRHCTLVVAPSHLQAALGIVPDYWGIIQAVPHDDGHTSLESLRPCGVSTDLDAYWMLTMIWRDEALRILESLGMDKGVRSKPRTMMWERLASRLSLQQVEDTVATTIRNRKPVPQPEYQ
jgi:hypothetical protein